MRLNLRRLGRERKPTTIEQELDIVDKANRRLRAEVEELQALLRRQEDQFDLLQVEYFLLLRNNRKPKVYTTGTRTGAGWIDRYYDELSYTSDNIQFPIYWKVEYPSTYSDSTSYYSGSTIQ